ncbi:putative phosphoserine phosphatase 2 [mine drainage metagenome]|uniref:Putative phosphoserine phosphatase 2 n=1 Tax=mine drainage metagenome TaxID=410659 RepID=A0A1J5R1D1_9ZZZZ
MQLTLVRHSSLDIASQICYGQSDVDVSAQFDDELRSLQKKLAAFSFDAVYASPLQRCQKLATALCADDSLGISTSNIKLDTRLKELSFGDWELSPWEAIPREIFDVWANDYANLAPPNGETFSQLHARTKSFIDEVGRHSQGKSVLVVTHGGVIRSVLAEVLNMPLKGLFRIAIDHVSVTQISFNGAVPSVRFVNL